MILIASILSIVSATLTYYLTKHFFISATRSSVLITLFGITILFLINQFYSFDFNYYCALIFGASFVGMSSTKILNYKKIIFSSIIFSILYLFLVPRLEGLGGALGFSAFLSVIFSNTLLNFSKRIN